MQLIRKKFFPIYFAILALPILLFISSLPSSAAEKNKFVVVIDAGHGGNDHGAIENGLNEKDITLSVAQSLGNLIKKKLKDTEVIYTRNSDTFISLQKRADIANSAKADLFISIHCNSVDRNNKNRANVQGATTYVLGHHKDSVNLEVARRENAVVELDGDDSMKYAQFDPTSAESNIIFEMTQKKTFQNSVRFAADVQREMEAAGRVSRGVQQAGFWVLWSTAMPSALIELDFICNPEQAKFLSSHEGQEKLVNAIFNAVKKYENYYRISLGKTSAPASVDKNSKQKETKNAGKKTVADAQPSKAPDNGTQVSEKASEESSVPVANEVVAQNSVSLPTASSDSGERSHRQETVTKKKGNDASHRRRSSSLREKGASQVEETMIAVIEEQVFYMEDADLPVTTSAKESDSGKSSKASSKGSRVAKNEVSKPGRRDKGKTLSRSGLKKSPEVGYRILLFTSDSKIKSNDAFKGLAPISEIKENNLYKYTYGNSSDRKEMDTLLAEVTQLFPEARVIKCYY